MKKTVSLFVSLLLIVSFIFSFPSCDVGNDGDDPAELECTDFSISEQVIYDENGIKVTVISSIFDKYGNPGLKMKVESNNADTAIVNLSGEAVNGVSISTIFSMLEEDGTETFSTELNTGNSVECMITFDKQMLAQIGIKDIKTIDLSIGTSFMGDDGENVQVGDNVVQVMPAYSEKIVTVKTSLFDGNKQTLNLDGITVYNENGVRITVNKAKSESARGVSDFYFALENVSNEYNVSAQITNFETYNSNGELVQLNRTPPSSEENVFVYETETIELLYAQGGGVSAGNVAISPAHWLEATLVEKDFKNVDKIRFRFTLSFTDPNSKDDSMDPPHMSIIDYELPYGEYAQTVEVDFSKKTVDTIWKYDPENIAHEEYTVDNGDGNIGETVIFDERGLKITLLSLTEDKEGVGLRIENNSDDTVGIYFDDTVVNGIDINNEAWLYWTYGSDYIGDKYGYGLCDLSGIAPGAYIETKYTPALIETKDSTSSGSSDAILHIPYKKVTGELKTLSFRLVIAYEKSENNLDPFNISLRHRTAKIININVDGQTK